MTDTMICPRCKKEITELFWWENKKVVLDLATLEQEATGEMEHSFDCPECGDSLNGTSEIQEIEEKLYGKW